MVDFYSCLTCMFVCHLHSLCGWCCHAVVKVPYWWFCQLRKYKLCIFYTSCDHFPSKTLTIFRFIYQFTLLLVSFNINLLRLVPDGYHWYCFKTFFFWYVQVFVGNPGVCDLRITVEDQHFLVQKKTFHHAHTCLLCVSATFYFTTTTWLAHAQILGAADS